MPKKIKQYLGAVIGAATLLVAAGCAQNSTDKENAAEQEVTIVTHESFPAEEFAAAASKALGFKVNVVSSGDGGELTNKLVLTKDAPIADAFYGVDGFFASRLIEEDVVEPYTAKSAESAKKFQFDSAGTITAIDDGAVCFNIDQQWFAEKGIPAPVSYEDIVDEKYRGLTVAIDPSGSSTGIAFLAGTIAKYGQDGFDDYWQKLVENEVRFEQGWSEAYYTHFTQGGENGTYPIVLSYASSPAYTVNEEATASTTTSLLETCTSSTEYAGVLKGAKNSEGAKALIDYMASREFQDTIAETMYMYPVDSAAYVPEVWQEFAPAPKDRNDVDLVEFGANRDRWLQEVDTIINN